MVGGMVSSKVMACINPHRFCLAGTLESSLAATSGVETAEQIVKYLLAGADTVMTTSALLRNGPAYVITLVAGLTIWLEQNGYASAAPLRGMKSLQRQANVGDLLRAQYMQLLSEYLPTQLSA